MERRGMENNLQNMQWPEMCGIETVCRLSPSQATGSAPAEIETTSILARGVVVLCDTCKGEAI